MSLRVLRWVGALLLAAAAVAAVIALLGPLTDLIARHDVAAFLGSQQASHLQGARETARTQLLTLGAGLFAAGALIYTARNFTLSRQGQVTGRYTQAIEQLGSEKLDIRVGGIYALEAVARDSAKDHPTVMEVLGTFIRENSCQQWPPPEPGTEIPKRLTRPDVQAAITVIGRRNVAHDRTPVNLRGINLSGADLSGANLSSSAGMAESAQRFIRSYLLTLRLGFQSFRSSWRSSVEVPTGVRHTIRDYSMTRIRNRTDFSSADLTRACLSGANLRRVSLVKTTLSSANLLAADLRDADLTAADLSKAFLRLADIKDANFTEADLSDAQLDFTHLIGANLTGANLTGADLTGADLTRANLAGAVLTDADLANARWPEGPSVPEGWERDSGSGRLKRAEATSGDATKS